MVTAVVTGSGSALPATLDQDAAWDGFFARHYEGVRAARRIFAGAGVRTRHAVANPVDEDLSNWSTGARMARYVQEALPLGKQAVAAALDDAGHVQRLRHRHRRLRHVRGRGEDHVRPDDQDRR